MNPDSFQPEPFLDFLTASSTAAIAVDRIESILHEHDFERYSESEKWSVVAGGRFYVRRGAGGLLAVRVGNESLETAGFRIAAAHSDSPALKLKPRGAKRKNGGLYVPVEVYGAPILSTWLDRELILTGRAVVRHGDSLIVRSFRADQPTAVIPNLAIHLNRDVNKGFEYNAQDHLQVRLAVGDDRNNGSQHGESDHDAGERIITSVIASILSCDPEEIVSMDVFVADPSPAVMLADGRTFVSGRIDNLAGCYSCLAGFLASPDDRTTKVLAVFDNEEVGSRTSGGADSGFLESVLLRLAGGDQTLLARSCSKSLLVSNDGAHALHDGFASKYDESYAPVLGGGVAIKTNASYRYASTSEALAVTREVARRADIPLQYLAGRSDMRTGSTIGPFAWSRTGMASVDLGVPMLAMHSIRETAQIDDVERLSTLIGELLAVNEEMLP